MCDPHIIGEPIQGTENVIPIVAFLIIASTAAQQLQLHGTGVVNVRRTIHYTVPEPPQAYCHGEEIALTHPKRNGKSQWHQQLPKGSAHHHQQTWCPKEQCVARLVKHQMNVVQDNVGGSDHNEIVLRQKEPALLDQHSQKDGTDNKPKRLMLPRQP